MGTLWIRVTYAALFALVIAFTFGFAVNMIYPGPTPPDTPSITFAELQTGGNSQQEANQIVQKVDRFYQDAYDFRRAYPGFTRNTFVALVAIAVVLAAIGVALPAGVNYLRLGLTLGAVLLLVYALIIVLTPAPNPAPVNSGTITDLLAAGSPPGLDFAGRFLRFAISFVGLLVLLFVGLWRLTDWAPRRVIGVSNAAVPLGPPYGAAGEQTGPAGGTPPVTIPPDPSPEQIQWKRPDLEN